MEHKSVDSANISSVGYDQNTLVMEVCFKHGPLYRYEDVPFSEYSAFMAAESKGKYFAQFIRPKYFGARV